MAANQFVTFKVDGRLLGLDVLQVREINRHLDITPVQRAPEYIAGLINLRGQVVTVFDLGIRLGLPPRQLTETTHNVILKAESVGLLVDDIGEVIQAKGGDMELPPANLAGIHGQFIEGVIKLEDDLLIILSADQLLACQEEAKGQGE